VVEEARGGSPRPVVRSTMAVSAQGDSGGSRGASVVVARDEGVPNEPILLN
jgi:hypothetical protein